MDKVSFCVSTLLLREGTTPPAHVSLPPDHPFFVVLFLSVRSTVVVWTERAAGGMYPTGRRQEKKEKVDVDIDIEESD